MYAFESSLKTLVWGTEQWLSPTESEFPLLVKFIETHMPLSIQVHPDDALAAERHHCLGKTEMWYVLDVEPGAYVYAGLTRSVSRDEVAAMVADGTITSVLRRCDVQKGDVVFLPAGCIHALGPGLKVVEIQENSAITYRLYDYNRPGLDGKPRQLHTQEAKDAIDYTVYPDYRTSYERRTDENVEVVSCPLFTTSVLDLTRAFSFATGGCGDFVILICCHGSAVVKSESGECLSISEGGAILVPAGDGNLEIVPDGKACLLTTHV